MLTLWDLMPTKRVLAWLSGRSPADHAPPAAAPSRTKPRQSRVRVAEAAPSVPKDSASRRYDALTRTMLEQHSVRVRKWRTSMSGIAWKVRYRDGSVVNLIEAPRPKGPMSAAVFLHEIGHHAIGFDTYKPRCLEEYHAWAWAIRQMEASGVEVTESVRYRMHQSLAYAVAKALRRGIKSLPAELEPFAQPLPPRNRRGSGR